MAAGMSIGSEEFAFTSDDNDWLEVDAIKFETITMNKEKKESRRDSQNLYQLSAELLDKQARFGAAGAAACGAAARPKPVRWWANIGSPKRVGASLPRRA
jgi:hypothetical protein